MPSAEELLNLEFEDLAVWHRAEGPTQLVYKPHSGKAERFEKLAKIPSALYAFVCDNTVMYIGKTAQSINKRFVGYRSPANGQRTNCRCNRNIRSLIEKGCEVRIFLFAPTANLQWGNFTLDVAAGLEDSLIGHFKPEWNGGDKATTESAELERSATEAEKTEEKAPEPTIAYSAIPFEIILGSTYYNYGLLNPGVDASNYLGKHDDPVIIRLGQEGEVVSKINRRANPNGSVRIVGGNREIGEFFRRHYQLGDTVKGEVINPTEIGLFVVQN